MSPGVRVKRPSLFQRQQFRSAKILYLAVFICLWLIILSFTPYTYHLDEIKVSMTYIFGPWLLCLFLYLNLINGVKAIPRSLAVPLLTLLTIMVISTIFSSFKWIGWIDTGLQIAFAGFFFATASSLINREMILKAVQVFIWIGLVTTVFGILQYAGLFLLIEKWYFPGSPALPFDYIRILVHTFANAREMFSTILNRDFYSGFLILLFPLTLSGLIIFEKPKLRLLSAVVLILESICIYLTFSKDSFAAAIIVVSFFLILYQSVVRYKKLEIPYLHIWVIGLIVIFGTLFFYTRHIVFSKLKGIDRSIESRSIIWYGSIRQFLESPIIGTGPGTFRIYFPKYRREDYFEHDISHVTLYSHNRYLDLLCETGVLGFSAYMWFSMAILYLGMRQIFRGRDGILRVIQLGLLSSIIGLLFTIIFSPSVRWVVIGTTYWVILGLSAGCSILESSMANNPPGEGNLGIRGWRLGMGKIPRAKILSGLLIFASVISLVSSVYGVRYFIGTYYHNVGLQYMNLVIDEKGGSLDPMNEKVLAEAEGNFLKALSYNPNFISTYYKLGTVYSTMGELGKAVATYKNLQRYWPDYAEIHYNLAVLNVRTGRLKEAVEEIKEAARESKKEQTRLMAGEIFLKSGKLEEAKGYYLSVLSQDPKNSAARGKLVDIYKLLNQPLEAEKYLLDLYKDYPEVEDIVDELIALYKKEKKLNAVESFLQGVIDANPLNLKTRFYLMQALYEQGKTQEALKQGIILEKMKFEEQRFYYLLARSYERVGDREKMREWLERTVAKDRQTSEGKAAEGLLKSLQKTPPNSR